MARKSTSVFFLILLASLLLNSCLQEETTSLPVQKTIISSDVIPIYKDPHAKIEDRVEDLLGMMTLAEKIGQMTQVEKGSINKKDMFGIRWRVAWNAE